MKLFHDYQKIEVRTEIELKKYDIEPILDLEQTILREYHVNNDPYSNHKEVRDLLSEKVRKKLSEEISEETLKTYLSMRENEGVDSDAILRGMYTGVLLDILCENSSYKSCEFDGKGKMFDYLFYMAKNIHNVTIRNFKGYAIFGFAGSYSGKVENIFASELEGEMIFKNIGIENGNANNIILTKSRGENYFFWAGTHKGTVKNVIISEVTGNAILSNMAAIDGTAENIIIANCNGDHILLMAGGSEKSIKNIILANITGNKLMTGVLSYRGSIQNITAIDIKGTDTFAGSRITNRKIKISKEKKKILDEIIKRVDLNSGEAIDARRDTFEEIARLQDELFDK